MERSRILRTWVQRYVIALGVVAVLTVAGVVGTNVVIDSKIAGIQRIHLRTADLPGSAKAANYLVIGSDTRAFVKSATDAQAFGTPSQAGVGGQRSDAIMIIHVDPDQHQSLIVSIPRDMVVDIPGVGRTRINAALGVGPQTLIDTLDQNFGIKIQHFVQVDFESFRGIVNAIGAVHVYFPYPARDKESGLAIATPGCIALDGAGSLAYVRSRTLEYEINGTWKNVSPLADIDRISRQQNFIRRLAAVAYQHSVTDPLVANVVVNAVLPKLKTDDNLGRDDIFGLVKAFRGVDPNNPNSIKTVTFPNKPYGDNARLLPKQPDADAVAVLLNQFGVPTTAPKPDSISVTVLNGSGAAGLAAATLTALHQQYGFVGLRSGNYPTRVAATEIRYAPGDLAAAQLVQTKVGGQGTLTSDPTLKLHTVTLVLGADFTTTGTRPPTATTTPPAAPTPSGTAPDPAAACKP